MSKNRLTLVLTTFAALAFIIGSCSTQADNTYLCDQFTNISPMPGGGWAVDRCGEIEGNGAFQVNIPVAYNPKGGYFVASGYAGGSPNDKNSFKNKTGIIGANIGGFPRLWLSGMFVSDTTGIANFQLQIVNETKTIPAISGGMQGVFKTDCNRLGYGVATKSFCLSGKTIYVTAGVRANSGNARGIGGISVPVNEYLNAAIEYDGLQFNSALIVRPMGLKSPVTLLGGYNGHAGWLAGISFNYNVTSPRAR